MVEVSHTMITFEISDNAAVHSLCMTVVLSQNPTSALINLETRSTIASCTNCISSYTSVLTMGYIRE